MSEVSDQTDAPVEPTAPRKRTLLGRIGCVLGLLIWAVLIFMPCIIGILVTQGEINIGLGSAPGQNLRIWLIMEPDERGIGISSPSVQQNGNQICVQTDVRYLLWMGSEEPSTYCDCYTRTAADTEWEYTETSLGRCEAP